MNTESERLRRWRLILGGGEADGTRCALAADDTRLDQCLAALYDGERGTGRQGRERRGSLSASAPRVARWLDDIRAFFPTAVVRVMQQDAIQRLGLQQMLLEPELLATLEADVHLVTTLMALKNVMPDKTRATARLVVRQVVDELLRKLEQPTRQAVIGSLNRAQRNRRPRHNEIDWQRTIRANLKHYQPAYRTIIPHTRIGFGHKRSSLRDIVLCIDQSGSMASSVVYASVFAAVLASLPAVNTHLVVFDTAVVDLSDDLHGDPVDLLFGVQLGGGTDINRALGYCQGLIQRPAETILVLISDLCEGGNRQAMLQRAAALVHAGVQVITLLALDDHGAPWYDHDIAAALSAMGIACFACTPDLFPDLMAAAIARRDLGAWTAAHDIATTRGGEAPDG